MNRYAINASGLGTGGSVSYVYLLASQAFRLVHTTAQLTVNKTLSAVQSFSFSGTTAVGFRVWLAAETMSLKAGFNAATMTIAKASYLYASQAFALVGAGKFIVKQRFSATQPMTLAGEIAAPTVYALNRLGGTGTFKLTGTGSFYDGPRTPAPDERTAGIVDLTTDPRTASAVSLGG